MLKMTTSICKMYKRPFTVCIEGNIGSGKTTFLSHFKEFNNTTVLQEPVELWRNVGGTNLLVRFFRYINKIYKFLYVITIFIYFLYYIIELLYSYIFIYKYYIVFIYIKLINIYLKYLGINVYRS